MLSRYNITTRYSFYFSFLSNELFLTSLGYLGILQQKLAKKDGAPIDRQNDIQVLWNFYLEYKSRRRVDDMQREQDRLRESGTYSTEYDLSLLGTVLFSYSNLFGCTFTRLLHNYILL